MQEEELLDEIFGVRKLWKGKYRIKWCDQCGTAIITCECSATSCNGGGCVKCSADFDEFNKAKTYPEVYMTQAEIDACEKEWFLKRYIMDSLALGEAEINWKRMLNDGELSEHCEKVFAKEITEYSEKNK